MNYLPQNNRRGGRRFGPIVFTVLCVLVMFGLVSLFPLFLPSVAHTIGKPFWSVGSFIADHTSVFRGFISSRTRLVEKNKELEDKLQQAQLLLDTRALVEQENKSLKESWGRNTDTSRVLASVLVRPPRTPYDTLVLDVGSDQGVSEGDVVVAADAVMLGIIDYVFEHTSRARLLSSVDTRTDAFISRNNIMVELVGTGGGNFEIRLPQDVDIVEGDDIVLPGITPRLVARVEAIESVPTDSFKRVFCKASAHVYQMRFVSVYTP